ncbi:MAG: hypothetical protein LPJ89_04345 [Hymenobacteraceae bacterium]|nr:hypothetical protein [Hymenobacteraceae bacterium]MDX5395831.1 hypothetical protein [Hymenobacteraceae bacterium]MDX5442995.1 hypothetical protein [Hymenobacteraceae bacterium]MDX5511886.1 hypothetical protein [Hymenobacteraceae bacterium]
MENLKGLWNLLRITYTIVPVVAGLDKFTNLLVDWEIYLGPLKGLIPFDPTTFMYIVGVIEIVAGIIVFFKTNLGGYIVMAWLISIAIVLIAGGYYDIAVRDLSMAVGAYVLARLTAIKGGVIHEPVR